MGHKSYAGNYYQPDLVVTERVRSVNCTRPFLVQVLILPCIKQWSGYVRLHTAGASIITLIIQVADFV